MNDKTTEKPEVRDAEAARNKGDAPVNREEQRATEKARASRTMRKECPDHPGVQMAETNEGVGVCNVPDCQYGPESLAQGSHPDMQDSADDQR